ncbi:MAG: hypothetical protein ACI37Z_10475 [Candidatus Gastranaerophilaceae bacterium]
MKKINNSKDFFGEVSFAGNVKTAPNKYQDFEGKDCTFVIMLHNDKRKDCVEIKTNNKTITPSFLWYENNGGRIRLCTKDGVFKIYI